MSPPEPIERAPRVIDYRRMLRKRGWLVVVTLVLAGGAAMAWTSRQVPVYQAVATVLIEPESPRVLNIPDVMPMGSSDQNFYPTQYEIIRSRPVLERAAAALTARASPGRVDGEPGDVYGRLTRGLVVEPRRTTRLVLIKIEGPDPARAAAEANAVASAYAKYNVELKLKGARDARVWLTEEAARLRKKVEESSLALQSYRVKAGILGMQELRQITAQKIMDFNRAYLEAQAQRLSLESKMRELAQITRDPEGAETIYTVAANPIIQRLKGEAVSLETERSRLLKVYRDKHPEVVKIDAQIRQVKERLVGELQNTLGAVQTEYKVAKAREDALLGQVNQHRREGQELNEKEIQYQNLEREVDSNQQIYDSVLKRLKETGVTGGLENNNVRIIEEATPPAHPIRPRETLNLVLGLAAGLALGLGLVFARECMDTTLRTADDVQRHLGLPVVAIVPVFQVRHRR